MSAIILDGRKTPVLLLHGNSSHGDIFHTPNIPGAFQNVRLFGNGDHGYKGN